jgi:hypothetical protein
MMYMLMKSLRVRRRKANDACDSETGGVE